MKGFYYFMLLSFGWNITINHWAVSLFPTVFTDSNSFCGNLPI